MAEAGRMLAVDYLDAQRIRADLGMRLLALFEVGVGVSRCRWRRVADRRAVRRPPATTVR
jgi:hypothetical protein